MSFDDLAKRMGGTGGGTGGVPGTKDPDQIMADAQQAAERSSRISDLILGPILLVGGSVVGVLCFSAVKQSGGLIQVIMREGLTYTAFEFDFAFVCVIGAIIVGCGKILRGLGLLKR